MMGRLKAFNELLKTQAWVRGLLIASGVLIITAIASFGARGPKSDKITTGSNDIGSEQGVSGPELSPGDATSVVTDGGSPIPGASVGPTVKKVTKGGVTSGGVSVEGLNFGLKTQGITAKEVKVGMSYNVAACGDAGVLQAMFANQAGDIKKAIDTFARYVNERGGVGGGRTYKPIIVDDGGSGCPEKSVAAAIKMADEEKVFLAIPGLDVVSDYVISRKVPVWGGRDDPDSLAKSGPNGLALFAPADPTLEAWASFGKHYLKSGTTKHTDLAAGNLPCLVRIETGASGNWDIPQTILVSKMKKYGMEFGDIMVFEDKLETAQSQSNTIVVRAKNKGCGHIYFMAGNSVGLIFMTDAATQNQYFPKWTWTSRTALSDDDNISKLMDQVQWENAIGLSTRVPGHPKAGNCKKIYETYNGNDGQGDSAAVLIACTGILSTSEIMNRGYKKTGVLDSNSFLLGADAIRNDFYWDAHVPMEYSFPSAAGPFKTRGFSHWTVADWSSTEGRYLFPKYPCYYRTFGPNNGGCEDLRATFK